MLTRIQLQTELDELDDPNSNETTQILYKQQIEEQSSQTHLLASMRNTPDPAININEKP